MSKHDGPAPIPIFDVQKWTIRMIIAALAAAALLVLARPQDRPYLIVPGLALATIGCLIRIWGCGHLRKNKFLATGGPYAFVRHPLYVGTFLIVVGLGLMGGSDWVMILLAVAILVYVFFYAPRKERKESDRLERRFGEEFVKYRQAVKSFFPRLTPYPERQGRFAWEGVRINREYLITIAVVFGAAVIVAKYFWATGQG
jgi:protein-S-isoprenylcysteine O-methyltransferase Ste14